MVCKTLQLCSLVSFLTASPVIHLVHSVMLISGLYLPQDFLSPFVLSSVISTKLGAIASAY